LLGAAAASPGRSLLVLACDLPFVPVGLLLALARLGAGADLVMPVSSRGPEPLAAFYGPSALAALTMAVERGELALNRLLEDGTLRVLRLEVARLSRHGDPALLFQNVNTAADLRAAESAGS
jgi:molybdopterin-guanine dinucleotide biosynthesis protein A